MMAPQVIRPKLLFIVTEDWFFCSHFQPMARAALADGFDVAVACRVRDHGDQIRALGCRLLPLEADRKSLNPLKILGTLARMRRLISVEQPDIVHLIALRSIIIGGISARLANVPRRVIALTGMGLLGAATTLKARIARALIRNTIRLGVDGRAARYLFENRSDPALLGLDPDDAARVLIVGGAGIDPDHLKPASLPPLPPLKLAMVARMLWSKGVDTAVEAVTQARVKGANVELALYGAPDPDNPKSIPEATLRAWAARPGITWHGKIEQADVPRIWASQHAAVLPSRGGEGLPRTLLEAAACGRALLTTNVPGCRDFTRNELDGFIVPPDDPAALGEAILRLAHDPALVAAMGSSARTRVMSNYTEKAVGEAVVRLYRAMLARW
jgi:glycosyltransferase involved in cell wall biosynthesis